MERLAQRILELVEADARLGVAALGGAGAADPHDLGLGGHVGAVGVALLIWFLITFARGSM